MRGDDRKEGKDNGGRLVADGELEVPEGGGGREEDGTEKFEGGGNLVRVESEVGELVECSWKGGDLVGVVGNGSADLEGLQGLRSEEMSAPQTPGVEDRWIPLTCKKGIEEERSILPGDGRNAQRLERRAMDGGESLLHEGGRNGVAALR